MLAPLFLGPLAVRGDEGFVVAPYLATCDTGAGCSSTSVPWREIRERCMDLDGCTVRISLVFSSIFDASVISRVVGVPRALGVQDGGAVWILNQSFSTDATSTADFVVGGNGNSTPEVVVEVDAGSLTGSCVLHDDTIARPTELSFELTATPAAPVICVVRIDD